VTLNKSRAGDSVLDFKRDLAEQLARQEQDDSTNTSETQTTEATDQEYQMMDQDQDYQAMDRDRDNGVYGHSTFRPPNQDNYRDNTNTQTLQMRQHQFQPPVTASMHNNADTIPSVPGYAKPFAHQTAPQQPPTTNSQATAQRGTNSRPYNPPPQPPQQRPRSAMVNHTHQNIMDLEPSPTEATVDESSQSSLPPPPHPAEESSQNSRMHRTKSMGEILETNFDDDSDSQPILAKQSTAHSRSMQLLHSGKLTMNGNLLETDM